MPVKKNSKKIPDIDELHLGPGKYYVERKLVERDLGKGVPRFQSVTNENDRNKQIEKDIISEVPDGIIFPNYDYDKPKKLVFTYKEPVFKGYFSRDKKAHKPRNFPEKALKEE